MKLRAKYRDNPFYCGSCDRRLAFKSVSWPIPVAHYVHADTHAFKCRPGWRAPSTHTRPLALPHDLRLRVHGPQRRPHDLREWSW